MAQELQGITLIDLAGMGPSARCVRALADLGLRGPLGPAVGWGLAGLGSASPRIMPSLQWACGQADGPAPNGCLTQPLILRLYHPELNLPPDSQESGGYFVPAARAKSIRRQETTWLSK